LASLLSQPFQRFADPAEEARYRAEQRGGQSKFVRTMAAIAAAIFTWYLVVNNLFVPTASVLATGFWHFSMLPLLIGYAWYVSRPGYIANRWVDIALFVAIQPAIYFSVLAFSSTGASGWGFHGEFAYALWIALAFACLALAASVRHFAGLCLAAAAYYPLILIAKCLPFPIVFYSGSFFGAFVFILFYMNWGMDDKARSLFAARSDLSHERDKSDRLLSSILPPLVAGRLREGDEIADEYSDVTVIFVDIVGFTGMARRWPARRTVEMLNAFFSLADHGVELFGLEKVKTIGDAYMAVAGALTRPPRATKAAIDFACYLIEGLPPLGERFGVDLRVHIGIHTGPVVGGVISAKRVSYDYWGDTINLAARLQDCAGPNGVAVSEAAWREVADAYPFAPPRRLELKGLGEVPVYDLVRAGIARAAAG
jgi:class 3 adenylate cyclase